MRTLPQLLRYHFFIRFESPRNQYDLLPCDILKSIIEIETNMMYANNILTRLPIALRWVAHLNILQFLELFRTDV